jgi:hypothetical protein
VNDKKVAEEDGVKEEKGRRRTKESKDKKRNWGGRGERSS